MAQTISITITSFNLLWLKFDSPRLKVAAECVAFVVELYQDKM
jgi:hypothetical protein